MSFSLCRSISALLLPPSNPEPWDGRQMCVSNSTASQAAPGSIGPERHYLNERSFKPVFTEQNFSLHTSPKKALISFLPLHLLKKTKARVSSLYKKKKKTTIPPLPFPTSFQSHERRQFISPLHQPTQSIQLSIFLTPHKLTSSPASEKLAG